MPAVPAVSCVLGLKAWMQGPSHLSNYRFGSVVNFIAIRSVKVQEPAAGLSWICCSGKMWVDIIIFLKVTIKIVKKKKNTTKNPQITMMELTSEQRKWWSLKVSVVMLEIIELFTSVIGV